MPASISAIADTSTSEIEDVRSYPQKQTVRLMANEEERWRDRLRAAVEASGRSMRDVSIDAKLNPGYLHSILEEGKSPTVPKAIKLANALDLPIVSLFEEADRTEARRRMQRIAGKLQPEQLRLLEAMASAMLQPSSQPPDTKDESDTA